MKRFHRIAKVAADESGAAIQLSLEFADGSKEDVEIERADISVLLKALFASAYALGELEPTNRELVATAPSDTVVVPSESVHALTQGDALWLIFRAGAIDLGFAFPDRKSASVLGQTLVDAAKQ